MNLSWREEVLGDVCSLINRGISPSYIETGGARVINQRCIRNHRVDYELARRNNLLVKRVPEGRFLQKGDGLINSTGEGTLGRVAWLDEKPDEDTTVDFHVTIVRPRDGLFSLRFFGYMLTCLETQLKASGEGCGGQTELSREKIFSFRVRFPGLQEQGRIVAILDQAFEKVDMAIVHTRQTFELIAEIFASRLRTSFQEGFASWATNRLDALGTITSSKRIYKHEYTAEGIPFYRTKEIKELAQGKKITTELFISLERYLEIRQSFGVPVKGDILMTAIGTIGETYVVADDAPFYFKDGNVLWLRQFSFLDPHFLRFALMSFVSELNVMSRGAAYSALPINRLESHIVKTPGIREQQRIVQHLQELANFCETLKTASLQKLAALEALKQSLLHQAFSGNL